MTNYFTGFTILSILLLWFPTITNGQGIAFEESNWEAVKARAKQENKPIFVDTYAAWCEPCKWMEENSFSKEVVGTFFKDNYISYKIDIEIEEGPTFSKEYRVTSFPTLLYFNSEGELVHRIIGAFNAEDLIAKSKAALNPENQIYTLKNKFDSGDRSSDFLCKYTYGLKSVNEPYQKVANLYLESQGEESLIEEENFQFLELFITDYNNKTYHYVLANKAKFVLALGNERVESYLEAAFNIKCYSLIENGSGKATVRAFLQDVKDVLPTRVDYFKTRIEFYANRGNERKEYRFAKKHGKHCKDSKSLNSLARYILDVYKGSHTHLNSALEWADKAIVLDENIYTLETKAMVLFELNRKEEALETAEKQLSLSKTVGEHIKETEALIAKISRAE
jgi:thiol-disulfide isomerase/thioredoxin